MKQIDRDQIIDDSGHNLDETVINILNDLAHDPSIDESKTQDSKEQIESFFDLSDDL